MREASRPPFATAVVGSLAVVKLSAHVATNAFGPYEFHRDEFLYFAMGEHFRLWHMDFPPLIAIESMVTRLLFGDSLVALRLPPAIMSTLLLILAALMAREFGGGRAAQGLAALAVFASGLFLRSGSLFQPVVIDQLWWTVALFALVKLGRTDDRRWWMLYGLATGFGLLSKFSILVFGFATLLALLATPARRWLRTPWPWIAAATALTLGSPSIIGQITLGFPIITYMGDLQSAQLSRVSPLSFLLEQPFMMSGFVLAVVGAAAMVGASAWAPYRLAGWAAVLSFLLLLLLRGKAYYTGPIYPILFAAGATVFERIPVPRWRTAAQWAVGAIMVVYTATFFPLGLPILPPEQLERYLIALGMQKTAATTNIGNRERIPQDYADMLNWEAQVAEIARVYHALPEADRLRAVILVSNYGEAGSIDFYDPRYELPPAIAYVGTYWFYGPGDLPGEVLILHGFPEDDWTELCGSRTAGGFVTHPFAVAEQRDLTIFVCRAPNTTLQDVWPQLERRQ